MRVESTTLQSLEFEEIRRILTGFVSSPLGRRQAASLLPLPDAVSILQELATLDECRAWVESAGLPGLGLAEDPRPVLERVSVAGVVLEATEILLLTDLARIGTGVLQSIRPVMGNYPQLARRFGTLPDLSSFVAEVERKILPNGEISEHASPALRQIRRSAETTRQKIQDILRSFMHKDAGGALQDQFITERNGRYVLPVRVDSPKRIEGVVHGTSSSGATLFVEPLKTVDLNNQLYRLQEQEREEIVRILREICERIHGRIHDWRHLLEAMAYLDLLSAKVRFGRAFQAVTPQLAVDGKMLLRDARHPLLVEQFRASGAQVVPISLQVGPDRRVVILSGPNTGGKTVALKTVGLLALMTACGLPVTAAEACVPLFEQILVDIGDQQSIQSNLSTFSAHLLSLRDIVEKAKPPALVLLDEVGTGTDPEQGAALAIAVIEDLKEQGALVVATTHYNRLKTYGYQATGVSNMAVEFDTQAMRPTYRLIDGVAGGSSGLEIAARLGMPAAIIDAARRLVDPRDLEADRQFEGIRRKLSELEELRQSLGIERQMAERERLELHSDYQARKEKLETEVKRKLDEQLKAFKAEADLTLRNLRNEIERSRLRRGTEKRLDQTRAKAQKSILGAPPGERPATPAAPDRELRVGDRVRILSLEQEGVVERADTPRVEVSISGKRWRIDRHDLEWIPEPGMTAQVSGSRQVSEGILLEMESDVEVPNELNLVGSRVEEALARVDKFLDDAVLANRRSVRLIHGHGKGILRGALAEFLTGHPQVSKVRLAGPEEGGPAITIVELKS